METFPKNACYGHPQTANGQDKEKQPGAKPCTDPLYLGGFNWGG